MAWRKSKEAREYEKAVQEDVNNEAAFANIAEEAKPYKADPDLFLKQAKQFASEGYNANQNGTTSFGPDDFYIVWFNKTLQNWKALLSTDKVDNGVYVEVTYNGDPMEAYVDVYYKQRNHVIKF